ncbi:MAG: hypothetical protein QE493_02450 [Verrucomicrobiae bacterium]|nr:hypothetical protein [Verrucomicrobiae bacterium]
MEAGLGLLPPLKPGQSPSQSPDRWWCPISLRGLLVMTSKQYGVSIEKKFNSLRGLLVMTSKQYGVSIEKKFKFIVPFAQVIP